jgi:hypothetical protein
MALRPKVNLVVLDPGSGKARPGAWVTFYTANTFTPAPLFADDDVTGITNPVQANGLGQVAVRVAPGTYDVSMTWDGAAPTIVEDVLAWSPEAVVITSPGDLIIGGPSGTSQRLAVGTNGQALIVEGGLPAWRTLSAGHGLPLGADNSLLSYGPGGVVTPIAPGLQDQTLSIQGGTPTWVSVLAAGQTLPINQPGDLVIGAPSTGNPIRLARGATEDVLKVASNGGLYWGRTDSIGPGGGQCYLWTVNGWLGLFPWEGNQIWINGAARTIPDGGTVGVPPVPGYAPGVTYNVYAYWDGLNILLDVSTVPFAQTGGLMHKSGDMSRTLVGQARLIDGPQWGTTARQRFLLTKFAPSVGQASSFFSAPRTMGVPHEAFAEIHTEIRCEFLSWSWEQTIVSMSGTALVSTPGTNVNTYMVLDGGVAVLTGNVQTSAIANEYISMATTWVGGFSDGYHYVTLHANTQNWSSVGTVTWHGDPNGITATRLHVLVNGGG